MLIYLAFGLGYANVTLIRNMIVMFGYDEAPFLLKLVCYLGDIILWPICVTYDIYKLIF